MEKARPRPVRCCVEPSFSRRRLPAIAQFGGGAYLAEVPIAIVENTTFASNLAFMGGGGAYAHGCALSLSRTAFRANGCVGIYPKGGGFYASDGTRAEVSKCAFEGNFVREDTQSATDVAAVQQLGAFQGGAAILRARTDKVSAAFEGCSFSGNDARIGGAIATLGAPKQSSTRPPVRTSAAAQSALGILTPSPNSCLRAQVRSLPASQRPHLKGTRRRRAGSSRSARAGRP